MIPIILISWVLKLTVSINYFLKIPYIHYNISIACAQLLHIFIDIVLNLFLYTCCHESFSESKQNNCSDVICLLS